MKFLRNSQLLVVSMILLTLNSCSSDDDDMPIAEGTFKAVTINLTGLGIELEDTSFSVEGYNFKAFRATSYTPDSSGILLAFAQDGQTSNIELDLSSANGLSKITANVSDYGGSTKISLWNDGSLVEEIAVVGGARDTDVVIPVGEKTIDALRFTSLEGDVKTIKLE